LNGVIIIMFRKIYASDKKYQEYYQFHKKLIDEFEKYVEQSNKNQIKKRSNKSGSYAKYLVRQIIISSEIFNLTYEKNDIQTIALYIDMLRDNAKFKEYNIAEGRFPNAAINEFIRFVNEGSFKTDNLKGNDSLVENGNARYKSLALNLYQVLTSKYKVKRKSFSYLELEQLGYKLGNFEKVISFNETNMILNSARVLKKIEKGLAVNQDEVKELEQILEEFKQSNINKHTEESQLEKMFRKLSIQSKEAIVNENEFDNFKEYMHIKRPIENQFEDAIVNHLIPKKKNILFIVGNVGDGKSHILSYMMKKHNKEFNNYNIKVHNDATETDSPKSTALDTMKRVLEPYNDSNIHDNQENRLVIAINLGILTNLITNLKHEGKFTYLIEYLEKTNILSSRQLEISEQEYFKIISFTEQMNFETDDNRIESDFYRQALNKVFSKSIENPFYKAYTDDKNSGMNKIVHQNYSLMLRDDFKEAIEYLLIRLGIEYKILISVRMLFNFFYDICMPKDNNSSYDSYLPFLLFENKTKSEIIDAINFMDPIKNQTNEIDSLSIELYHAKDTYRKVLELFGDDSEVFYKIFQPFKNNVEEFDKFINTYLRLQFLMDSNSSLFDDSNYQEFLDYYIRIKNNEFCEEIFLLVNRTLYKWNGDSGEDGYIIKNTGIDDVKLLVEVMLEPKNQYISGTDIVLEFSVDDVELELIIDFRTFEILKKLDKGYFLKKEDRQLASQFNSFVDKTLKSLNKSNKIILLDLSTHNKYEMRKFMSQTKLVKGNK